MHDHREERFTARVIELKSDHSEALTPFMTRSGTQSSYRYGSRRLALHLVTAQALALTSVFVGSAEAQSASPARSSRYGVGWTAGAAVVPSIGILAGVRIGRRSSTYEFPSLTMDVVHAGPGTIILPSIGVNILHGPFYTGGSLVRVGGGVAEDGMRAAAHAGYLFTSGIRLEARAIFVTNPVLLAQIGYPLLNW